MKIIFVTAILLASLLNGYAVNPTAKYIQRTLSALEASTEENPSHVRVLVYGQSITAQNWTDIVQRDLKTRYPTVDFKFHKASIGGYTSPLLIRTADHDLYPWYPDLLFFHVYGPVDKYEEIIKRVRERTSAEIVLWTSHINARSGITTEAESLPDDERSKKIKAVAKKYNCMLIDLRSKWYDYLKENNLKVDDLLLDGTHLNNKGCEVYGNIIKEELVPVPGAACQSASSGTISKIPFDSASVHKAVDGRITLSFTGNRVVAVSDGEGAKGATARVLLDGEPMDGMKELWVHTRASVGPARIWMPAINHIGFENPLVEEDWVLTCLPDSSPDGKEIHFKLGGSKTGADGEGWNTKRFVSNSGRVILEPNDWHIGWILNYRKATLPEGFQVKWKSYPLFTNDYKPQPVGTRTLLVQGCANGEHTLTIIPQGGDLGIQEFVVYAPAK